MQTTEFVWTALINESGWSSNGIAFLTGLINPNYVYAGIDGAIHLAGECSNASMAVPFALMSTLSIGFITSFAFVIAMLYAMVDMDSVIGTPTEVPIYEIWLQATRSGAAATVFVCMLAIIGFFALNGCQQTASRLTWAFARDDALVMSKYFNRIHTNLQVPVYALLANSFVVFIIGCIYLASTTAFNALIGTGLILQQVSFIFPAALLLYRRRSSTYLPANRRFRLGVFGWVANIVTIAFGILTLVFYCFPSEMPVTGGNMSKWLYFLGGNGRLTSLDYSVVVIGTMAIFTVINWFIHAHRHDQGPRLPVELTQGEL